MLDDEEKEALKLELENLKIMDDYDREADKEDEPIVPQYEPILKKQTAFFTSGKVEEFTEDLSSYLYSIFATNDKDEKPSEDPDQRIIEETYKFSKFDVTYRVKVEGKKCKVKFNIIDKRSAEPIKVTVKFYYIDENKKYIEFNRKEGDQLIFLEYFRNMKKSKQLRVFIDETLI